MGEVTGDVGLRDINFDLPHAGDSMIVDGVSEGLVDIANDLASLDYLAEVAVSCEVDSAAALVAEPEFVSFDVFLANTTPEHVVTLRSKASERLTITAFRENGEEFSIVRYPKLPAVLDSCETCSLAIRMAGTGKMLDDITARLEVDYTVGGVSGTLVVKVTGNRMLPEWVECKLKASSVRELDLSVEGSEVVVILENEGLGLCAPVKIGIADCPVVDGLAVCPGPEFCTDSKVFNLETFMAPGEKYPELASGDTSNLVISYRRERDFPPELPAYGIIYAVAVEGVTRNVRYVPVPVMAEDGTASYPWNVRLVE